MTETYLYLNSMESVEPTNNKGDYRWNLRWNGTDSTNYLLYIDEVSFPNAIYPVNSNYNTVLYTDSQDGAISITLDSQDYNGTQLAAELATKMNAAATLASYTVTYSSQTYKITVTAAAGTISFTSGTALHVLGFRSPTTAAISYAGQDPVRLDGSAYCDLITSIGKSSYSTNEKTNTFYRIPIQSDIGSMVYYQHSVGAGIKIQDSNLSSFNIRLFDDRGNSYALPQNCSIALTIRLVPVGK